MSGEARLFIEFTVHRALREVHRDMMQRCVARCFPAAREENTIDRLRERYGDLPPTVRDLDTGELITVDELERRELGAAVGAAPLSRLDMSRGDEELTVALRSLLQSRCVPRWLSERRSAPRRSRCVDC